MARPPRINIPNAFYHVMARGNNKTPIFFNDDDRRYFLFLLSETIKKFKYKIHSYCLMTNHIHLLVETGDIPLSKIMHDIEFRYAIWVNDTQKRCGHVFQGRFKSKLVKHDEYLLGLVRYIHLNPVEANIVENIDDFTWSSHLVYIKKRHQKWLTRDFILGMLSENDDQALIFYNELVNTNDSKKNSAAFISETNALEYLQPIVNSHINHDPILKLIELIEMKLGILLSDSNTKAYLQLKALVCVLAEKYDLATISTLATYFNCNKSTISRIIANNKSDVILKILEKCIFVDENQQLHTDATKGTDPEGSPQVN